MQLAGVRPQKGLGQHFLVDQTSLEAVAKAGDLQPGDTVLEIGPGLGTLTRLLADSSRRVVGVEQDPALAELLGRQKLPGVEVVWGDIRRFDFRQLGASYKVVANIPYYLTGLLFPLLLESPVPPSRMVLLVQKEVAERVTAKPGAMSILALSVQYYAQPEIVRLVERHKFWPVPKVDSAILKVILRSKPAFAADPAKLFRLIKAGFGEKRKQLKNSLAGGLNIEPALAVAILDQAGINPTKRSQDLSLAEWHKLYERAMKRGILE